MGIADFFKKWEFIDDANITFVFSYLLFLSDENGGIRNAIPTLIKLTGLSRKIIGRTISKLCSTGYLKEIKGKDKDNRLIYITICNYDSYKEQKNGEANCLSIDGIYKVNTKEEKIERDSLPDKKEKEESNIKNNNKELPIFEKEENKENISVADATVSESNSDDQRTADEARDFYNSKIDENHSGMTKIKSRITGRRKAMLLSRIKEYGKESVGTVIDEATKSSFLGGGGPKGWKADFEWIMRPNNFPKVLDGNYNNQNINYGAKGNIEQRMRDYAEVGAKFERMADEDIWNREHGIKKEDDIPF